MKNLFGLFSLIKSLWLSENIWCLGFILDKVCKFNFDDIIHCTCHILSIGQKLDYLMHVPAVDESTMLHSLLSFCCSRSALEIGDM